MLRYGGNYSHAGSWPDPDILFGSGPVGPKGQSKVCKGAGALEYCTGSFCDPVASHSIAQFVLWSIMGAPLMLSFDVAALTESQLDSVYGNEEIIAVNQDADAHGNGVPGGRRVSGADLPEVSVAGTGAANPASGGALAPGSPVLGAQNYLASPTSASPPSLGLGSTPSADIVRGPPKTCTPSTFPVNRTGQQVRGLGCANATTPATCMAACCAQAACSTWQYSPTYGRGAEHCWKDGKGVFGPCWIGTATHVGPPTPNSDWVGGSNQAAPSPPSPPPRAASLSVWARNLNDGSTAVLFINNLAGALTMACDVASQP